MTEQPNDTPEQPPISVREEAARRLAATFVHRGDTPFLHKAFTEADEIASWIADLLHDDTCRRCHGDGVLGEEKLPCGICGGRGFVRHTMVTEKIDESENS